MTDERKLSVCVFCASSMGKNPVYEQAAKSLGRALALSGRELIYGGGSKGLMGAVAQGALSHSGKVHGVIPQAFVESGEKGSTGAQFKTTHPEGSQVTVVKGMHERKLKMSELAEGGFVALPGGYGTFEEVLEMVTWSQLHIHPTSKPIVCLSVRGFFEPLRAQLKLAAEEGFIDPRNLGFLQIVDADDDADWGSLGIKALESFEHDGEAGYLGLKWV